MLRVTFISSFYGITEASVSNNLKATAVRDDLNLRFSKNFPRRTLDRCRSVPLARVKSKSGELEIEVLIT